MRCGRPAELGDVLVAGLDALTDRGLLARRTDRQRLLTIGFDDLWGILHHANRCTGHHLSRRTASPHRRPRCSQPMRMDGVFRPASGRVPLTAVSTVLPITVTAMTRRSNVSPAEEEPATSRALEPGGAPLAGPLRPIRCRVRAGQDEPGAA